MIKLSVDPDVYQAKSPYPHVAIANAVDTTLALKCQEEILHIPDEAWDRYDNPFEQKYTLRNKDNLPKNCMSLFNELTSDDFITNLSSIVGEKLYTDPTKNWWGIHKYKNNDYLDVHSDAGIHPVTNQKKHVTLGIYLSKNWNECNGGYLEIWDGDSVVGEGAGLSHQVAKILPSFNKLVLFNNTNNAWHGNPEPVKCDGNSVRVFVTVSYLSENHTAPYDNMRKKAFFVKRPTDPDDPDKDRLRILRADETRYKEVYSYNKTNSK